MLRNDDMETDPTMVIIDCDPWQFRWEQENYICEEQLYRQAMTPRIPIDSQPQWLYQGLVHLNYLDSRDKTKKD